MISYFDLFPQKAQSELRTVRFPPDLEDFPPGLFIFTEFYCPDLDCDCQRVLIKVLRDSGPDVEEVATINYCWQPDTDPLWARLNAEQGNPFLDPLHPQAPYAGRLLDFWSQMVVGDRAYAARLQRHYGELREQAGVHSKTRASSPADEPPTTAAEKRATRARRKKQAKSRARRR